MLIHVHICRSHTFVKERVYDTNFVPLIKSIIIYDTDFVPEDCSITLENSQEYKIASK